MEVLPEDGVQGLSAAHHLTSFIELAEMLSITDTMVPVSDKECSTEDCGKMPIAWCGTCANLCEDCLLSHSKMRITKSHAVQLIKELQRERDVPLKCERHMEQNKEYNCMNCNKMVCPKCLAYCSDCNKLICGDCLKEHGYPNDPDESSPPTSRKSGLHSVHLLKQLIEDGEACEKELERVERELKSLDETTHMYIDNLKNNVEKMRGNWSNKITSRRKDCKKRREQLGNAGKTAGHFIKGERVISSPEETFKSLMEYSSPAASINSSKSTLGDANSASSSSSVWLQWSVDNESKNMKMIERIQPHHISVNFPVNPFHVSEDNWFHIALTNLFPVRPSAESTLPKVIIKGEDSGSLYSSSIELVGNMTWFVLFNTNDRLIEVSVSIDGVKAQGSPFKLEGVYNDKQSNDLWIHEPTASTAKC